MDEIVPGVCYPLFLYLVISLSGILGIMLEGGENSGLMSFFVFVIMIFSTLFINMFCFHDWGSIAWIGSLISLGLTLFIVNDPSFGNVNIIGYIASMVAWVVDKLSQVYAAFQYVTAKRHS